MPQSMAVRILQNADTKTHLQVQVDLVKDKGEGAWRSTGELPNVMPA